MDHKKKSEHHIRNTARHILDLIKDADMDIYDQLETLKKVREALQTEANEELNARHYG